MTEYPSFSYEETKGPEGTRFDDGTELDFHKSKLGTPEQGRAPAEAARIAETAIHSSVERQPIYGHEEAILTTRYVLGARRAELTGSPTLVLGRSGYDDKAT